MNRPLAYFLISTIFLPAQGSGFDAGWSKQASGTLSNLRGISFSNSSIWIAVGDGGTIRRSSDGGITWSSVSSPVGDDLRGVSFRGSIGMAVGIAGRVLRSTDGGLNWIQINRPTTRNLYSVSLGSSVAVLTGEEGTIFISTDDGISWSQRTAGTASVLFGASVYDGTAVGVGGQATIVNSVNDGQGWGLQILGPTQQLFFYGTSFVSATTGWAVGSYAPTGSIILKSTLSGFVWTVQTAPTANILFGVSFASLDTGTAVGFNGTIVHTTNGGSEWFSQQSNTLQSLNAVSFIDASTGITVGDSGTILRTTNGGLTDVKPPAQSSEPTPFHLEQNFPNPFNPTTTITFTMRQPGFANLTLYNILGEEVAILVNREMNTGTYAVSFDGRGLASGTYIYRLAILDGSRSGLFTASKQLLLLR